MRFFQSVTSLAELKKYYRLLSLELHPDRPNGNAKAFIQMKDEYDTLYNFLSKSNTANEKFYESSSLDKFTDIIDAIINFDLDIEICGSWIWASGNTYNCKDKLKELGFKWAKAKKQWYWHQGEYVRKSKKTFSMDEIREMHGSETVKQRSKKPQLT